MPLGLSEREWATVFWLSVFIGFCFLTPKVRRGFAPVLRSVLHWRIALTFLVTAVYFLLVLRLGYLAHLWTGELIKDSVFWYISSGFSLGFAALAAMKDGNFFRHEAKALLGAAVVLQFVMNLSSFSLIIELLIQPVAAVLVGVSVVTGGKPEQRSVKRLADGLLALLGLAVLLFSVVKLVQGFDRLDVPLTLLQFAFSVWLPAAMLPLTYVLALVMTLGQTMSRMKALTGEQLPLAIRWQLPLGTRFDLRRARELQASRATVDALARERDGRARWGLLRSFMRTRNRGGSE